MGICVHLLINSGVGGRERVRQVFYKVSDIFMVRGTMFNMYKGEFFFILALRPYSTHQNVHDSRVPSKHTYKTKIPPHTRTVLSPYFSQCMLICSSPPPDTCQHPRELEVLAGVLGVGNGRSCTCILSSLERELYGCVEQQFGFVIDIKQLSGHVHFHDEQ